MCQCLMLKSYSGGIILMHNKRSDVAKSPYKPYTPESEQLALVPEISGNTVNGLGETEFRRPTHVYWSDPDNIPHGELQKFFYRQNQDNPAIRDARAARDELTATQVPPVNSPPLQQSAQQWSTPRQIYGVDDFCSRCQVCANACPPDAIGPEKVQVRGVEKWYVDFDKCIPFFNENYGCSICISVCPWSIPDRGPGIVEQLLRRQQRQKKAE